MNAYTLDHPGPLVLRTLVAALFMLLTLLPMLVRRWRGPTTQDAESAADTAIAVKRAEVRAQVDQLWAEQELHGAPDGRRGAERDRRRAPAPPGRRGAQSVGALGGGPAARGIQPRTGGSQGAGAAPRWRRCRSFPTSPGPPCG